LHADKQFAESNRCETPEPRGGQSRAAPKGTHIQDFFGLLLEGKFFCPAAFSG
jgi:hypothetical protein